MDKILIITPLQDETELFEQAFQGIIENGGELLFCSTQEEALKILPQERPILVFVDSELYSQSLQAGLNQGSHLVTLRSVHQEKKSQEEIIRPLRPDLLLEKCQPYLSLEPGRPVWPM